MTEDISFVFHNAEKHFKDNILIYIQVIYIFVNPISRGKYDFDKRKSHACVSRREKYCFWLLNMNYSVSVLISMHIVYCCNAYDSDKTHFSAFSDVSPFRTLSRVSLSRCVYECKTRLQCDVIEYSTTGKECALIKENSTVTVERRPGRVGGRKGDWDMVNTDTHYVLTHNYAIYCDFHACKNEIIRSQIVICFFAQNVYVVYTLETPQT